MTFVQGLLYFNFLLLISVFIMHLVFFYSRRRKYNGSTEKEETENNYLSESAYKKAMDQLRAEAMVEPESLRDTDLNEKSREVFRSFEKSQTSVLEALIHYYLREALKEGILFTTQVSKELSEEQIQQYHVIHIVGNLLQNALEALMREDMPINRKMELQIEVTESELTIKLSNTYPEALCKEADLERWTQAGYSSKGTDNRGNGLSIIKRLIKEKDGMLYLDTEHDITFIVEFDL